MEFFQENLWVATSSNKNLCFFIPVPPQKPLIVDDRGRTVEGEMGIGPFREGESLSLECNVPGGKKVISIAFMAALWPFLLIKKPQNYRRAILGQLILANRTLN